MMKNTDYWLDLILRCAKNAYKNIKDIAGTTKAGERLTKGAGGDITLLIDKTAENIIINTLKEAKIPFKLITEEEGEKIFQENDYNEKSNKDIIVVDPIDGSSNAAYGFPFSCISIAHANGNSLEDVDCGIIININNGDIFKAIKGKGAFKNDKPISVNENKEIIKSIFGINLSLNESLVDYSKRYDFLFIPFLKIRAMGSDALALCMLASGHLDCFLNIQRKTRILDIAAGYLLLLEAGGEIWDMDGVRLNAPLAINSRVSFLGLNSGLQNHFKKMIPQLKEAYKKQPAPF